MRQLDNNIWVAESPQKMLGIEYGVRMTCIRLATGGVVLISPIKWTKDLAAAVDALGPVSYLIAPTSFHHLYIKEWAEKNPAAKLLVVPQLVAKRKDLKPSAVIDSAFKPDWGADLQLLFVEGGRLYSEAVFLHTKSRTLVLTDLCFNLQRIDGFYPTVALKLYGVYKKFGPSKAVALFMGDKGKLLAAVAHMATWDFTRVIVAHGDIWEGASPSKLQHAFSSILRSARG